MTEDQIIQAFYEDIKTHKVYEFNSKDWQWFIDRRQSTERYVASELLWRLPDPISQFAYREMRGTPGDTCELEDFFSIAFNWSKSKHGSLWKQLYNYMSTSNHNFPIDLVNEAMAEDRWKTDERV